jgi:hypothetical protein
MGTKSSAIANSGFHAEKNLHLAQWTAQLVIGVRALRNMVNDASSEDPGLVGPHSRLGSPRGRHALPPFDPERGDRTSSPS